MTSQTRQPLSVPTFRPSHWTACSFPNVQNCLHTSLVFECIDFFCLKDTNFTFFTQRNFTLSSKLGSTVNSSAKISWNPSFSSRLILPIRFTELLVHTTIMVIIIYLISLFGYQFPQINEEIPIRTVTTLSLVLCHH